MRMRPPIAHKEVAESDVLFKEYKKGKSVIRQNERDGNIYIIYKGKCRILLSLDGSFTECLPQQIKTQNSHIVLDYLHKG